MDLDEGTQVDRETASEAARPAGAPRGRFALGHASKLLLEAALIVLSVLLGFALNEWQQNRADDRLTRSVIANVRREIAANLAYLQRVQPKHAELTSRLAAAATTTHGDSSAFEVFSAVMPESGLELAPLQEVAWETANTTGALRLLDYRTAAVISETYLDQRAILSNTRQLLSDRFFTPANFDPASQRTMLQTQHMLFNELSAQEAYLMNVYRRALRKLPDPDVGKS